MKVKMIRMSGNPVDPEIFEQKNSLWQSTFDELIEKHGKHGPEIEKALSSFETELHAKYNDLTVEQVEVPRTLKDWKAFHDRYGNVMFTTVMESNEHAKKGDLLLVIMDMMS